MVCIALGTAWSRGLQPPPRGSGAEKQAVDVVLPEPMLAVLQGAVHLISAWHLHGFSQLSSLRQKV